MSIPLSTTTISVLRRPADSPGVDEDWGDPYEPEAFVQVLSGIRAHISLGRGQDGQEIVAGGSQELIEYRLDCDPIDLRNTDRVIDDFTGTTFEVVWAFGRRGLGLDHLAAGLKTVKGTA